MLIIIYFNIFFVKSKQYCYNAEKVKTANRHDNGLPEKPTAHQADRQ